MAETDELRLEDDDNSEMNGSVAANTDDEPDLETLEKEMAEIEEEQQKLRKIQSDIEGTLNMSQGSNSGSTLSAEEQSEVDSRSVYVGNVDYGSTAKELVEHFHGCGPVIRVTINTDKYTGHPKGFAYVEFETKDGMQNALAMDDSLFRGRQIKVVAKRTNKPGISTTNRGRPRGARGGRVMVRYIYAGGPFRPRGRGRGRHHFFAPY